MHKATIMFETGKGHDHESTLYRAGRWITQNFIRVEPVFRLLAPHWNNTKFYRGDSIGPTHIYSTLYILSTLG